MLWRSRNDIGLGGENLTAEFLKSSGMRVVDRRAHTPYGEIDLVCLNGDEVVFVEVKTRTSGEYGFPEESVTETKQRHLRNSASWYLSKKRWGDRDWRIDVVSVDREGSVVHFEDAVIGAVEC